MLLRHCRASRMTHRKLKAFHCRPIEKRRPHSQWGLRRHRGTDIPQRRAKRACDFIKVHGIRALVCVCVRGGEVGQLP